MPTCASAPSIRGAIWSRTPSSTWNVLEAMRASGVQRIAFSSTGTSTASRDVFPTPETAPFPVQTSLYGASKLAAEGLIAAYCDGFGFSGVHLPLRLHPGRTLHARPRVRFLPPAAGASRAARRARQRPAAQDLPLRPGLRRRHPAGRASAPRRRSNIFNLGTDEYCQVNDSIGWITEALGVSPKLALRRRRARMDRRQPVHLPGLRAHAVVRAGSRS